MISNLFQNIPHITKNILLINIVLFVATIAFQGQYNLTQELGAHTFNSPLFKPYQMVSHFFMHGNLAHLFFNMFALLMFGSQLERVWGPKRYFIFYIATAIGAFLLYSGIGTYEMYQVKMKIIEAIPDSDETFLLLNQQIISDAKSGQYVRYIEPLLNDYYRAGRVPMVGASGAIFGLLAAFGMLFPNTQLMLLFPPIPIKAKFLVIGLMVIEVYLSLNQSEGDNVAHLAHIGGGIVGFIIVKFWQKNRSNFF